MNTDMLWLLALGAGGGLLHALDADHILAVSTVAAGGDASRRRVLRTALNWALGHGLSLGVVTLSVLGLGLAMPEGLSAMAELLVGVILLAAGLSLLWAGWRGEVALSLHRHGGLPAHAHLHGRDHVGAPGRGLVDHRPVLIGIIHGVAGSAPLLALLPLVIKAQFRPPAATPDCTPHPSPDERYSPPPPHSSENGGCRAYSECTGRIGSAGLLARVRRPPSRHPARRRTRCCPG